MRDYLRQQHEELKRRHVLVAEPDSKLLNQLVMHLDDSGFTNVVRASSAAETLDAYELHAPSLLVMEIDLKDGSGLDVLQQLRTTSDVPVIFITGFDDIETKTHAFMFGCDDYIVKPFELMAVSLRAIAVMRRCYRNKSPELFLEAATVDMSNATVERYRPDRKTPETLTLTAKEYSLLNVLSETPNRLVTGDHLCTAVWGRDAFDCNKTLMTHVRRLREKIEPDPARPVSLVTVRGLGYRLNTCTRPCLSAAQ